MKQLTSIDLFAGIGGIRLGFDQAFGNTLKTVFVSEWDENAQKTYKANFKKPSDISGDITQISETNIPAFDICLAGFPCQAFSLAGQRKGFTDDYKGMSRGTLFFDVVRICAHHKPKVIFCENVKGLTIHDKGRTFDIIKGTLKEIGYTVHEEILNSKDFGVPQNRERIYIVAFRNDIDSSTFKFPKPTDSSKKIKNIIEEKPVSAKYYLSDVYMETLRRHRARHEEKGHGFGYEIRDLNDIAGAIVCGGMGRERNLIIDNRQTDLTPVTKIKGKINTEGIRKMTPREWARLQGYPESFSLNVADVHLYKQFGNSVSVPVIRAIAENIKKILNKKLKFKPKKEKGRAAMLLETGIVKKANKTLDVFNTSVSEYFLDIPQMSPSEYVRFCWDRYTNFRADNPQDNSMNGNIFELIIQTELYRRSLCPMFLQAKVAFVPNVNFDVLLYSSENFPIGLSLKTSLRERYKQADLEAVALKYVHRRALNYLITLESAEADNLKIKTREGELLGINNVVVANSPDFDELIEKLSEMDFISPGQINIIEASNIITRN
ncbi:MAG: DNA (cytosine-5-)-methyltransferase [Defluviitaleaceae bacterium]|nr:DNA (cytosine-5-)-methyltransferase [Defluviitaleaceae bacterium]